jgi:WD40 repeat protein
MGSPRGAPVAASQSRTVPSRLPLTTTARFVRHRQLGKHRDVTSVALGEVEGRAVVVSGAEDGTVRLWDAATGAPRGKLLTGHKGSVMSVAVGHVQGRAVVVSAGRDGTVRLWDAATGATRGQPITGHEDSVRSVAVGKLDGRAVLVSAGWNGTARLWDLATCAGSATLPVLDVATAVAVTEGGLVVAAGSAVLTIDISGLGIVDA